MQSKNFQEIIKYKFSTLKWHWYKLLFNLEQNQLHNSNYVTTFSQSLQSNVSFNPECMSKLYKIWFLKNIHFFDRPRQVLEVAKYYKNIGCCKIHRMNLHMAMFFSNFDIPDKAKNISTRRLRHIFARS